MEALEVVFFILLAVGILALAVYFRVREQRYLKKKTSETFSKELREEIEEERSETIRKREKFKEQFKRFGGE
jgi:predicted Holliday junction resolvase-like endonuclease